MKAATAVFLHIPLRGFYRSLVASSETDLGQAATCEGVPGEVSAKSARLPIAPGRKHAVLYALADAELNYGDTNALEKLAARAAQERLVPTNQSSLPSRAFCLSLTS